MRGMRARSIFAYVIRPRSSMFRLAVIDARGVDACGNLSPLMWTNTYERPNCLNLAADYRNLWLLKTNPQRDG